MSLNNHQITVTNGISVHLCTTGFGDPCTIINMGTGILFIGDNSPVTNLNGLPLSSGGVTMINPNCKIDLSAFQGEVWGYAHTANCTVAIIENKAG